jgi:hypothetical protein
MTVELLSLLRVSLMLVQPRTCSLSYAGQDDGDSLLRWQCTPANRAVKKADAETGDQVQLAAPLSPS